MTETSKGWLAGYTKFLQPIIEQDGMNAVICTLTFPYEEQDQLAERIFVNFIDFLESRRGTRIGWIRGDEKRFASSWSTRPASGRHFHCILFSFAPLDPVAIEHWWKALVGLGGGISTLGGETGLTLGGYARVRQYDPTRKGLEYCLKSIGQDGCDWAFSSNIELFISDTYKTANSRMRRQIRRLRQWRRLPFRSKNRDTITATTV